MSVTGSTIPSNNRAFIVQALQEGLRVDGRWLMDYRRIRIKLSPDGSTANVAMGATRVMTSVTYTLGKPQESRPVEGVVRFSVVISPMCSPLVAEGGSSGAVGDAERELVRLLEQVFVVNRTLDREALCVIPGSKVWLVRVESTILDAGGNLEDALLLAATAALRGVRLPQVEMHVGADDRPSVVVYDAAVKEPAPLTFQQQLYPVSFAVFEGGIVVVDPTAAEEGAAQARVSVVLSPAHCIAVFQKLGGLGMAYEEVQKVLQHAKERVGPLATQLDEALKEHAVKRDAAKVRRQGAPGPAPAARAIAVLPRHPIQGGTTDAAEDMSSDDEEVGEGGGASTGEGASPMDEDGAAAEGAVEQHAAKQGKSTKKRMRPQETEGSWRAAAAERRKEKDADGQASDAATLSALVAGVDAAHEGQDVDLRSSVKAKKRTAGS